MRQTWFTISTFGVLLAGCAPTGPACYPVRGQVTLDGKPLAEAMVVFYPQPEDTGGKQKPVACTDSDGHFELTTLRPGDGAPPGEYVITVELRATRIVGEEVVRDGRNLLPARYARPQESGFKCQVTEGENDVPTIALKRS